MNQHIPPRINPAASLLRGAAVLGVAALLSKLLGVLQKVPLQNIGGDEAFGIYSIVYPFYTLILVAATAGFPVAVSKFVADSVSVGDRANAKRVLRQACIFLTLTGWICFAFLYFGADWIGAWIGNRHTVPAIQSVAFALWFVPVMSALRGYFQGMQNMIPTAVSQVWEQLLRVAAMVVFLYYTTSRSMSSDIVAAGATLGSAVGALSGLMVMLYYGLKERRRESRLHLQKDKAAIRTHARATSTPGELFSKLAAYAIPVCLGAIVMPILNIVDTFSLPRLLTAQGLTEQQATQQFGVYARGLPLMQMVSMLFSSMAVAIVPAIAESKARKDWGGLASRVVNPIRMSWLIGLASSVGLAVLSMPVNVMLYKNDTGSWTIFILAWSIVFSVLNIITSSVLQGLDAVKIPALHLLAAAGIKVILNVLWVPLYGIQGAAWAAVLSFMLAALLNVIYLIRRSYLKIRWLDDIWKPAASVFVMGIAVWCWKEGMDIAFDWIWPDASIRITALAVTLSSVLAGAAVYGLLLIKLKVLSKEQLEIVPLIGSKLAARK